MAPLHALLALLYEQRKSSSKGNSVAALTIRNLDSAVKDRLRVRVAEHGHSMEAEARQILQTALAAATARNANLYDRVRARFASLGGVALDVPKREEAGEPPGFE